MRTWSVSGTAFALCTRSSSLSMRTSTSMNPRSLQRKHYSLVLPKRRLKKPRFFAGSGVGSGSGGGSGSGCGADSDSGGLRDGSSRASFVPKTQRRPLSRSCSSRFFASSGLRSTSPGELSSSTSRAAAPGLPRTFSFWASSSASLRGSVTLPPLPASRRPSSRCVSFIPLGSPASPAARPETSPRTVSRPPPERAVNLSPERGDLLHATRRDEADLRARHHVDRFDLGRECPVELVHLELPLEV